MTSSLDHLVDALSSPRFLQPRGVRDVPFFILPYQPELAEDMMRLLLRLVRRLDDKGLRALTVDLYDLTIDLLRRRDLLDRLIDQEASLGKGKVKEVLQNVLDPESHLAPAVATAITTGGPADLVLLTGIGELFPFVRAHSLLANLERSASDTPLLLLFPGEYAPGQAGASLKLFNLMGDDRYYRAADIRHFEF